MSFRALLVAAWFGCAASLYLDPKSMLELLKLKASGRAFHGSSIWSALGGTRQVRTVAFGYTHLCKQFVESRPWVIQALRSHKRELPTCSTETVRAAYSRSPDGIPLCHRSRTRAASSEWRLQSIAPTSRFNKRALSPVRSP